MLKWLYKKPDIFTITHKDFKTLKISKIVKNIEDVLELLLFLQNYPEIYNGKWDIYHSFDKERLSVTEIIQLHNSCPLNTPIELDVINQKISESNFVIHQRQIIFVTEYLKDFTNTIELKDFISKKDENDIIEILKSAKTEEELEDEFGKLVNADEYFQRFINDCKITGHALFLYDDVQKDINLYQFHTFNDFYDNLKKVIIVYPKEFLRYSVSDELLTIDDYIKFLKLFGPFSNLEKCETVEELNEWIVNGRYLAIIEDALNQQDFNNV